MSIERPSHTSETAQEAPSIGSLARRLELLRAKSTPSPEAAVSEESRAEAAKAREELVQEIVDMAEGNSRHDERLKSNEFINAGRMGRGLTETEGKAHGAVLHEFEQLQQTLEQLETLKRDAERSRMGTQIEEAEQLLRDIEEEKRAVQVRMSRNSVSFGDTHAALQEAGQRADQFEYEQREIAKDPIGFAVDQVLTLHKEAGGKNYSENREWFVNRARQIIEARNYQQEHP